MHVASLQAPDAQHVCANICAQHCRLVYAHVSMRASRTRGKAQAHLSSHAYMQI